MLTFLHSRNLVSICVVTIELCVFGASASVGALFVFAYFSQNTLQMAKNVLY